MKRRVGHSTNYPQYTRISLPKAFIWVGACVLIAGYGVSCDRGEEFTTEPGTMAVSLAADPSGGAAPLVVELTAAIGGSPVPPLVYRFDCTNDGQFDIEVTTDANPYTHPSTCTYSDTGTYTPKVVLEYSGGSTSATTSVSVTSGQTGSADSLVVLMDDNFFLSADVTVEPGTRIIWRNTGGRPHTATSDDSLWDSGTLQSGESWSWTVPSDAQPGATLPYYCVFHGDAGGIGMAGTIRVGTPASSNDSVVVSMKDSFFSAADIVVQPGTRIVWTNTGLIAHTSTSDDGLWDSGTLQPGESWSWTVPSDAADGTTLAYYCVFHGDVGGVGMAGVIRIVVPSPPTDTVVVAMQDNVFAAPDITVRPGTKIVWDNTGNRPHTSTADDGTWDSGTVDAGQRWSWIVPSSTPLGTTLPYYCVFHGDVGGVGMAGVIRVDSVPPPPPTPPDSLVVQMQDNFFTDDTVTVLPGTKIVWDNTGNRPHTSTADDGTWDSGTVDAGQRWSWIVPASTPLGTTLPYYCVFHGDVGGQGMAGVIQVDSAPPPPPPTPPDSVVVQMQDDFFTDASLTVLPGTKIVWDNTGNRPHTSTADDGTWDSGTVDAGQRWSWIVPASTPLGTTLPYYCQFHGDVGGQGMAGVIQVDSAPPPPPPPASVDTVTMTADQFIPERVEIPVGGMVTWIFSGITHNVTFDGPAPAGGNIPDTPPGSAISRTFIAPGDYDYECTLHNGHKGRVRVQ